MGLGQGRPGRQPVEGYASFAELKAACAKVLAKLNTRPWPPCEELLAIEAARLHFIPDALFTAPSATWGSVN